MYQSMLGYDIWKKKYKINMMRLKKTFLSLSLISLSLTCSAQTPFWLGADISGTTEMEAKGEVLYDQHGNIIENTALMKQLGLNAIRLRVWVNPRGGFSGAQDVLKMAERARYYGMAVMIDFHYSDWWADPGKQPIPAAWQYYAVGEMREVLAAHTRETLRLLREHHIDVRWVQVGNETTHGFLWPMAKAEENMDNYALLTKAGCEAVKEIYPKAQIIIHLDGGCDLSRYLRIFDALKQRGVSWDIIGMSVYPYWDMEAGLEKNWQGSVHDFASNVIQLYKRYGTESMIVETGVQVKYPMQSKQILKAIIEAARHKTDGHCLGVFYWAPELEGEYPLGAFKDHRPTVIMDAFKEAK